MNVHLLRLWLLPMAAAAVSLEILAYRLRGRAYPWKEFAASTGVLALRLPMRLLRPLIVAPLTLLAWSHRLFTVPLDTAWGLLLLFLGEELAYYWMHRCSHEVRWLWASHVVHHTPGQIHFASAYRLGATELLSGSWLFYVPLYLLGLNPLAVSAMLGINLLYQFWLHTDLVGRLGPFEWVFNTPSHHRVHHACNRAYLDRNYGGIVIIWDRLFGTFAGEQPGTVLVYGLVHPLGSLNPFTLALHEWGAMARDVRRARSIADAVRQLFGRPGDSHSNRAVPEATLP
jgi:sterol desaturase/sphingolipid hydroxylase (fatty acid hydroxylase superfamily)